MNDNRSANHFVYGKTIRYKQGERKSIVFKQRRQVTGVVGMLTAAWVVMRHGVRKRIIHIAPALGPRVDMKSQYLFMARKLGMGQAANLRPDDYPLSCLVKSHFS